MTNALEKNFRYDREMIEVMRRVVRRGDLLVDVGCHRGAMLRQMMDLGAEVEVHAFEPIDFLHAELLRTFGNFPNVHIHRLALADHNGPTSFHLVRSNLGYSGFRRRTYPRPDESVERVQVTAARLDDVLPPVPGTPVRFIKVDVEGAELAVLLGATAILRRERPFVVFEHGLGAADHYGTAPEEVYDLLAGECGLQLSTMRAWLRSDPPLARSAFIDTFRTGREFYYLAHP